LRRWEDVGARFDRITIKLSDDERGFTLVELCVVMVILGILTLVATPSYFSFRTKAMKAAAKANVKNAQVAVQAFYQDSQTYAPASMTIAALKIYDKALPTITVRSGSTSSYCISSQVGTWVMYKAGPAADITDTACS
jgi:type IV pilus assembly protein PilA